MKPFDKLKLKVQQELGLELTDFQRLRPGIHQRKEGHWAWIAKDKHGNEYGSKDSVALLIEPVFGLTLSNNEITTK
jgi:predicted DNA-binding protein (MmcQ/YjbR family)